MQQTYCGGLTGRVRRLLVRPDTEWPTIEREPDDAAALLLKYAAVLILVPVLAGFVGNVLIGTSVPGIGFVRMPVLAGLLEAVLRYVFAFVAVYLVALFADLLAPWFGGRRDFGKALKLAVYSHTPAWLAGIFLLIPGLTFLIVLGLYGAYPLWLGLPVLMKTPPQGGRAYAAIVVIVAVLLALVFWLLQTALVVMSG